MRSEVMYRDLPGGPLVVKFADEVSLWCLCSKCGMFSKDMFQDSASHVFCSVCVFECSERKKIHCKHERRDVPVDDMVQAFDVSHVMSDQTVFCPNAQNGNGCKEFCALKDLENHYLKCAATKINCLSCGSTINGSDWEQHINNCPQKTLQCRYCALALPRAILQAHEEQCYDNQSARLQLKNTTPAPDSSVSSQKLSTQKESKANWNNAVSIGTTVTEAPVSSLGSPLEPTCTNVESDDSVLQCIYCERNVKRKNMERHSKMCWQNKKRAAVSAAENFPGNIAITPDSRNTPMVGSYDPPLEATTFKNSLSWDPHWFAENSRNTTVVAPSAHFGEVTDLQTSPLCDPQWLSPDSRSTSIAGSKNPYQEAIAALENSVLSHDQHPERCRCTCTKDPAAAPQTQRCATSPGIADASEETLVPSLVQCGIEIATAVGSVTVGPIKGLLQTVISVFGPNPVATETAQESDVGPQVTSCSRGPDQSAIPPAPWPAQPTYRCISEWFNDFDAWLKRHHIGTEEVQFMLLLNKVPETVAWALRYLESQPNPYTAARRTVLHQFQSKDHT